MCLVRLLRPSPSNLSRAPGCTAGFAVCHDRIPSPRRWRRPTLPFLAPDDRRKLCSAAAAASADMPAVGPGPSFAPAPAVVLKGTARRLAESAPAPRGARRVGARAAALWRPHPIPAPLLPSETPFLFKSPWPAPGAPSPATLTPPTPSRPTLHAPLPLGVPPESRVPGGGSPTLRLPGQASLRVMTSPTSARAIPLPQPLRLIVTGPAPGRRPRPPPDSNHGDARGPPCPARVGAGRIGADSDETSMSSLAGRACQVRSKVRHAGPFSYSRVPR